MALSAWASTSTLLRNGRRNQVRTRPQPKSFKPQSSQEALALSGATPQILRWFACKQIQCCHPLNAGTTREPSTLSAVSSQKRVLLLFGREPFQLCRALSLWTVPNSFLTRLPKKSCKLHWRALATSQSKYTPLWSLLFALLFSHFHSTTSKPRCKSKKLMPKELCHTKTCLTVLTSLWQERVWLDFGLAFRPITSA